MTSSDIVVCGEDRLLSQHVNNTEMETSGLELPPLVYPLQEDSSYGLVAMVTEPRLFLVNVFSDMLPSCQASESLFSSLQLPSPPLPP